MSVTSQQLLYALSVFNILAYFLSIESSLVNIICDITVHFLFTIYRKSD